MFNVFVVCSKRKNSFYGYYNKHNRYNVFLLQISVQKRKKSSRKRVNNIFYSTRFF